MLGDHGLWGKDVPYQPSVGVPLIAAGPGVKQNLVSNAPLTTMDLAATFLDYAGLERPADMDSRSLRPVLEGQTTHHRDWALSGLGSWRLSFNGRYKFVEGFAAGSQPLLFDLQQDPGENAPLIGHPPPASKSEQ